MLNKMKNFFANNLEAIASGLAYVYGSDNRTFID